MIPTAKAGGFPFPPELSRPKIDRGAAQLPALLRPGGAAMTATFSPAARQIAAKVSRAFAQDQQLATRLEDAHGRRLAANDRLWSGLRPDGLAAIYGEHSQLEAVCLEESVHSGSEVLGSTDPLGALQDVHWPQPR